MNKCISSQWYELESNRFYVNIWDNNWIDTRKDLLQICVKCNEFIKCKKLDILLTLLLQNG